MQLERAAHLTFRRRQSPSARLRTVPVTEGPGSLAQRFPYCFVIVTPRLNVCPLPAPGVTVIVTVELPTGVT